MFYNINIKAINSAVNLKCYCCSTRSKQYASMFMWLFLPYSCVFYLWKLGESLLKSLKITLKNIVKSILRGRKTAGKLPKNSLILWEKQLSKEWFANIIACPALTNDNNNNNITLTSFPYYRLTNSKVKFTLQKRFIMYYWVMNALGRHLGRIAKLTRIRGIVYWHHQRVQNAMEICSTLALLNFIKQIF